MGEMPVLSICGIKKEFPMSDERASLEVLRGVSLDVGEGEFVCILGQSGCGKSTLLRIAAGLERQDMGEVYLDGALHDKPCKDVLMLFQDFNQLFPWLTVTKNVAYPLRHIRGGSTKEEALRRAGEIVDMVGLSKFRNSYPHELSGGMKQRVAVARALAVSPKVLLMDEPFAALDAATRASLQELTRDMCAKNDISVLFVTHNVDEAVLLGDRIVVMNHRTGTIEKIMDNSGRTARGRDEAERFAGEIVGMLNAMQEGT